MNRGIVVSSFAPIMKEPDEYSQCVDEVLHGMIVNVVRAFGDWLEIITDYYYKGFLHKKYLLLNEEALDFWESNKLHFINHYSADVLSKPVVQANIIINLTLGCFVIKTEEVYDGYTKIILPGGTFGYIRNVYLNKPIDKELYMDERVFRERVVETARSYLTTQYRWGGKTPLGIDCSGLCFMAYYLNGVVIFRDSEINSALPIKKIPLSSIKFGDLLYFPGHVAMYIGSGKIIHSSIANNGVFINSIIEHDADYNAKLAKTIKYAGSIF